MQDAAINNNPLIATFELTTTNYQLNTLTFKITNNDITNPLPNQVTFVKDTPSFEKDLESVENYCNKKSIINLKN